MICIPMVMVIKILQSEGPLIEVSEVSRPSLQNYSLFSTLAMRQTSLCSHVDLYFSAWLKGQDTGSDN